MGPTWKSVVLAVAVGLAAIYSAHGQPVPPVGDAGARLAPSPGAVSQFNLSQSVSPDDPWIREADGMSAAMAPNSLSIGAYLAGLELLLAVVVAIACLSALALAGVVVKRQQRRRPAAVPAGSRLATRILVPVEKFPI